MLEQPCAAVGTEPGSASLSAAASSVGAAVVYRHRAINSTGKEFVFCVHMSSHRPRDQGLSRKVCENFNSLVC